MRGGANVYSLPENLFSRAMCAVMADQSSHRFLVGTNSYKKENEVHLINYSEDSNRIDQESVFQIENGEIWTLSSSPYDRNVFACGLQSTKEGQNDHVVNLYDIQEVKESHKDFDKKCLKVKSQLKASSESQAHQNQIHSIQWEDTEYSEGQISKELVTADNDRINIWDLKTSQIKASLDPKTFFTNSQDEESLNECTVVKRDPHHKNLLCVGVEKGFIQIDQRVATGKNQDSILQKRAHSDLIMDLDYNPNKLNTIATCGQDSVLRFWDLRKIDKSILEFEEDSHWISKVKFNKFHDQLLITGCTSTFVSLYRASSVSQMPLSNVNLNDLNTTNTFMMTSMTMPDDGYGPETSRMMTQTHRGEGEDLQDKLVQRYELEDSVHVIDWSASDAWIFAGVSYNGTFFLNVVPSKEKYKILL
eukprot:403357700